MNVVASERRIVSQSDTLTIVGERRPPHQRDVLADAVEDDDRVVDRVAEDGQDRRDRRRRHLGPMSEYMPIAISTSCAARSIGTANFHWKRKLMYSDDQEERKEDREDRASQRSAAEARRDVRELTSTTLELGLRTAARARCCSAAVSASVRSLNSRKRPPTSAPRPWTTASLLTDRAAWCADVRDRPAVPSGTRSACRPRSRCRGSGPERERADRERDHGQRRSRTRSSACRRSRAGSSARSLCRRAHELGVVEPAETGEQSEQGARREHGGHDRDRGADQQHQREPADAGRRQRTGRAQ